MPPAEGSTEVPGTVLQWHGLFAVRGGPGMGEEFGGGLAGRLGVLDEVSGVEDFDEGAGGVGGALAALVFGALGREAVEVVEDALGVGVVVPGDEVGEGDLQAIGDGGGGFVCRVVGVEEFVLGFFGQGAGFDGLVRGDLGGVRRGRRTPAPCGIIILMVMGRAERAQRSGSADGP